MKIRACLVLLMLVCLAGCGDSKAVKLVKAGKLPNCSQPTMEQAVKRIFTTQKWTSGADPATKGLSRVSVAGNLKFKGQDATGEMQFTVNEQNGNSELTAFKLNGAPQPKEIVTAFFTTACQK